MSKKAVQKFIEVYQILDKNNLDKLEDIYSESIHFVDALHELHGLPALQRYFSHLYENLLYCKFTITDSIITSDKATVSWDMNYAHPKIAKGKNITVQGASILHHDTKITYHHDYMDMGKMLYEHLPILGSVIRAVQKKVQS